MKEFLELFLKLIQKLMIIPNATDDELMARLRNGYSEMSQNEKTNCIDTIENMVEDDHMLKLYILSVLIQVCNDERIVCDIQKILQDTAIPAINRISAMGQLSRYLFNNVVSMDKIEYISKQISVWENEILSVIQACEIDIGYIPYDKRNKKRIILIMEPVLGVDHSPTRRMINLYRYLIENGYEVYVCSSNMKNIHISCTTEWYKSYWDNTLVNESGEYIYDIGDVEIPTYHINYTIDNFKNEVRNIITKIADLNPMCVISVGDQNMLADICNKFTTVVTMGCTNNMPITIAPLIARYFDCTEKQNKQYIDCKLDYQKIIDVRFRDRELHKEKKAFDKEDFGISKETFLIMVVGNRLDFEVTDEVLEVLDRILDNRKNVSIGFIGKCNIIENKVKNKKHNSRYIFFGETKYFEEMIGMGDLFFNPPRQGGGTGATMSIKHGIPIVTLGNCDVSAFGECFVCEDLEDMYYKVMRYIDDEEFREKQIEYCTQIKNTFKINSKENIRLFIKEIENTIINIEDNID